MEIIMSIALGLALASAAGFRLFVPMAVTSYASHFNAVELGESWSWMGSTTAMIIFSVAMLLELGAYFIPVLDNLLDGISLPLAGIAGSVLFASTMIDMNPVWKWVLAIVAGGGAAVGIKGKTALIRGGSTVMTAGIGNFALSALETIVVITICVLAILVPLASFLFIMYLLIKLLKNIF